MLAIGRALMGRPDLLMMDEPSLGLAPLVVTQIFEIIIQLAARGVAILLVEQNVGLALEIADYAYGLENGRIVVSGPADKMLADPRIVELYLPVGGASSASAAHARPSCAIAASPSTARAAL
jgi:branched-chain amino acid transport system ATP-binding protein